MSNRDQRLTFVILWLFALMNYIYGDIAMTFSLFVHPEQLARLQQGLTAGGNENFYFLGGAIFMNIAFLMLPISWLASQRVARWANMGAGMIFTLAMATIARPLVNFSPYAGREEAELGYDALKRGDNPQALRWLKDSVRINPRSGGTWYNLGIAYQRAKQYPQALDAYRRAAELSPEPVHQTTLNEFEEWLAQRQSGE